MGIELYHSGVAQVMTLALPVTVGGAMLAPGIIDFVFGAPYAPAAPVLRILIVSIPLLLLRSVAQATLLAAGRQDRVLHATAIAALVTVALNLLLIPPLGMTGAAITTVCAELARLAAAAVYSHAAAYPFPSLGRAWKAGVATALMAAVLLVLPAPGLWIAVPAGATVYALALYTMGAQRTKAQT
jgi:O-antigen/teichoic acid export membrane protein